MRRASIVCMIDTHDDVTREKALFWDGMGWDDMR